MELTAMFKSSKESVMAKRKTPTIQELLQKAREAQKLLATPSSIPNVFQQLRAQATLKKALTELAKVELRAIVPHYTPTLNMIEGEPHKWEIENQPNLQVAVEGQEISGALNDGDVFRLYCNTLLGWSAYRGEVTKGKLELVITPQLIGFNEEAYLAGLTFVRLGASVTHPVTISAKPSPAALRLKAALMGEEVEGVQVGTYHDDELGFTLSIATEKQLQSNRLLVAARLQTDTPQEAGAEFRVNFDASDRQSWFNAIQFGSDQDQFGLTHAHLRSGAAQSTVTAELKLKGDKVLKVSLEVTVAQ